MKPRINPMKFAVSVFGNQPMPRIVERVQKIEALGFDAVWFGDLQRICREVYVEMTVCAPQHIPEVPGPTVDETIQYFAEEVMPHVD